jgi:hypothetical protein
LTQGMMVLGCWIVIAGLLTLTQPLDPAISPSPRSPLLWHVTVLIVVALDLAWMANGLNPMVPTEFFDVKKDASVAGRTYWFAQYEHDVIFGSEESEDELAAQGKQPIEGYFDVTDYRIATQNWRVIRASGLPNINMLDRVPSLSNNDPLLPAHYSQYIDLIEELGADAGPLLQAANVTQVYGTVPDGWQGENPAVAPYADTVAQAWLVPEAIWLDSDDAIQAALRDPNWDPMQTVILSGSYENALATSGGGAVTVIESSPNQHRYHVTANSAEYLVITETWYPGWSATVNGTKADLYRANLAFQAVAVPAGESEIALCYDLKHWRLGAAVTALSLLIALALILSVRLKSVSGGEV